MRNKRIWLAAGLALSVSVTACGNEPQASDSKRDWMGGLNETQRMEDFANLCDGLRDNYPYLALAKRQVGADIEVLEKDYQQKVRKCTNDDMFYATLHDFVGEFAHTGHLELWGRRYESELESMEKLAADPAWGEKYEPYIATLDNPVSHRTYAAMTKFYQEMEVQQQEGKRTEVVDGLEESDVVEESCETIADNVETEILEPGKIAYVSIDGFDYEQIQTDREILLSFYEEVWDYDNLVIDITNNLGGSMLYFDELVAAPLARKTLTVSTYQLFKDGENNNRFLKTEDGIKNGSYRPARELPDLPALNREDASACAYFLQEDYTVYPQSSGFRGKIWLLVSENNYSSSEYAAMFAKASGFATLVGEITSGDGIGTDPVYLILPNSGLVVQYSPMYGVTADGTGSEEFGTIPDILSPPGETALETCLRYIE